MLHLVVPPACAPCLPADWLSGYGYCCGSGMGVTALEAFSLGVPVVTLPSRQTVPALVSGMLAIMDLQVGMAGELLGVTLLESSVVVS